MALGETSWLSAGDVFGESAGQVARFTSTVVQATGDGRAVVAGVGGAGDVVGVDTAVVVAVDGVGGVAEASTS